MSTEKEPDVVDLTKENKDTPGKSKKLKQPRIAFAKINKQEYLETVKTTIVDESKKRKISSDVEDEANAKSPKAKPKKCKTDMPKSEADSKPKEDLKTTKVPKNEKRKSSSTADDKATVKSPKIESKKAKTETPSKPKPGENLKPKEVSKHDSKEETSNIKPDSAEQELEPDDTPKQENEKPEVVEESKDEPMEVDTSASPSKLSVSAQNETPIIENKIPLKTPEAKLQSSKKSDLSSPVEKKLTPKQLARKAEFEKKRLEKEKQKEEARLARELEREKEREKKEAEKKEKEAQKEAEKKEKEAQREAERKEKEAQKEKERLEREQKKQELIDEKERIKKEKEDERLKKKKEQEEKKEAERLMKEEQAKKKQEEAEEKEKQEKAKAEKIKQSFAKFFVKKDVSENVSNTEAPSQVSNNGLNEFRIKKDMKIAPLVRREDFDKKELDQSINSGIVKQKLYVKTLTSGKCTPRSQGKTWPYVSRKDDDNDIQIIEEDEDDEIGEEAEVVDNEEEPKSKTTAMTSAGASKVNVKAKFLSFHDNQRPAYFGTWSKKSSKVTARRPFGKDNDRFDYDYDSDDDWEEEEQGESLSDEEKDMEEDEKEAEIDADADQEDDGFFVGHGVLDKDEVNGGSDCEMDMDDELEIKKQKLKAQQFEDEYKKKKPAKLKPRIFGCFWNDPAKERDEVEQIAYGQCMEILTRFKAVSLCNNNGIRTLIPTAISNPPQMTIQDPSPSNKDDSANKIKTLKQVPEESVPELIRLVHANYNNKNFLAKEFSEVWHKKNELSKLPMTKIVSKITEIAEYQKSEVLTRKAWMVKEQFLKQYGILEPAIPNNWEYLLEQPMKKVTVSTPSTPTVNNQSASTSKTPVSEKLETPKAEKTLKANVASPASLITKFLVKPKDASKEEPKNEAVPDKSSSPKTSMEKTAKLITPRRIQLTKVEPSTKVEDTPSPSTSGVNSTPKANPLSKFLVKNEQTVDKTAKPITPRRIQLTKVESSPKDTPEASTPSANSKTPKAKNPLTKFLVKPKADKEQETEVAMTEKTSPKVGADKTGKQMAPEATPLVDLTESGNE